MARENRMIGTNKNEHKNVFKNRNVQQQPMQQQTMQQSKPQQNVNQMWRQPQQQFGGMKMGQQQQMSAPGFGKQITQKFGQQMPQQFGHQMQQQFSGQEYNNQFQQGNMWRVGVENKASKKKQKRSFFQYKFFKPLSQRTNSFYEGISVTHSTKKTSYKRHSANTQIN